MPSKSAAQAKLMRAVAHNPAFAKKVGVPQSVGQEFMKADKRKMKKFELGGPTSYAESGSAGGSNISFKDAFKAARDNKQKEFKWFNPKKGKMETFTTELASEKKPSSEVKVTKTETSVEAPSVSGPRSGGRGSKPGMARVGTGRYDDPTSTFGERVTAPLRKLGDLFGRREEERVMRSMNVGRDEARKRLEAREAASGMRGGGKIKKYAGGGSVSSASKRADGIAKKGKTRGKIC